MEVISRKEAKARGLKHYIGKPCKHGHIGERFVTSGNCFDCYRLKSAEQTKRFREANPLYPTWVNMKARCENPNNPAFPDYGGRGITVSPEWSVSFEAFLSDMGSRPSHKHTLDRINNDIGYCKENCRWSTKREQASNRRNNNHPGMIGVYRRGNSFEARITINGREVRLGTFDAVEEAQAAYLAAVNAEFVDAG